MKTFFVWTSSGFLLSVFWGGLVYLFSHNLFWTFIASLIVFAFVYIIWGACENWRAMHEALDRMEQKR